MCIIIGVLRASESVWTGQYWINVRSFDFAGLVTMSGQGSGSGGSGSYGGGGSGASGNGGGCSTTSGLIQGASLPGGYQPMDCESSPRHSASRRAMTTGYPSSSSSASGGPTSAPTSIQSIDNSLIPSSLGSYNSLILPGIPHLPAMMTSPMIHQQQNFYNYGYPSGDAHGMVVRQPSAVSTGKQRDPEREDSPMVGVCVQQSPVAIHWIDEKTPPPQTPPTRDEFVSTGDATLTESNRNKREKRK